MYKVTLKARGKHFEYLAAEGQSPLQAAKNEFIPFPVGCQSGGCGMCKVKVLDGNYEQNLVRSHQALSDEELENNFALGCCMTPKSDLELITIEDYESDIQNADFGGNRSKVLNQKYSLTESLVLKILEAISNKAEGLKVSMNTDVEDKGEKFSINITIN